MLSGSMGCRGRSKSNDFVIEIDFKENLTERRVNDGILTAKNELFKKYSKAAAAKYYEIFISYSEATKKIKFGVSRESEFNCTWPRNQVIDNPFANYSDDKCLKLLKKYVKELIDNALEDVNEDACRVISEVARYLNI